MLHPQSTELNVVAAQRDQEQPHLEDTKQLSATEGPNSTASCGRELLWGPCGQEDAVRDSGEE
jgi:hypothetical protein